MDSMAPAQEMPLPAMTPTQALMQGFEIDVDVDPKHETLQTARRVHASGAQDEQQRQGFIVGGLHLMIRYDEGSELSEVPRLYPLPNVPAWFQGFANLQGVLVPVFDLAGYLGLDGKPPSHPLLLVLSHGENAAGVVINGMPQRLRWSAADQADSSAAPSAVAPHLRGASQIGEQLWFDLECNSLLDALEQAMGATA